ncbi:hypothetical protein [Paraburkholderia azotifigens]|uniref:Uncharacterized protein n=1 Tax=Paraburkholderia azotifigens TaxID=2057004 RepID=A0ABU9RGV8_9BURK
MKKPARKYLTEFALNIFSAEPTMVAPAHLDELADESAEVRERIKDANIYLILKRPRIFIVPQLLRIENRQIVGELAVQLPHATQQFPFAVRGELPEAVMSVRTAGYPYTKLSLFDADGELLITYPVAYLMRYTAADLGELDNQEVVYVGQAFGTAGERTAVERLSSHSTLQKILADITANEPHMEVLLALYSFSFHRFYLSIDGTTPALLGDSADDEHRKKILESQFKRSMRISMAEAALIRYFEPKYNKVYTKDFPHNRLKMLKTLYELDIAALVVEASVEDHRMRMFSPKQGPNSHHIAKFDLHDKASRKSFFFDAP